MKRDWELMRSVLLEVEALTPSQTANFKYFQPYASDDPEAERARHALMLYEAGYLNGTHASFLSEGDQLLAPVLTMQGADLLDKIKSESVWQKMKSIGKERGVGLAFDSIGGLAKLAIDKMLE